MKLWRHIATIFFRETLAYSWNPGELAFLPPISLFGVAWIFGLWNMEPKQI